MATIATVSPEELEDPLAYLPCSRVLQYYNGQLVYGVGHPPSQLNLIIEGKVKVSRVSESGRQLVVDIYRKDEFFGECVFLGGRAPAEQALALEDIKLMTWPMKTVEEIMARQAKLGIALLQLLAQRSLDLNARLESVSVDNIARRLAGNLIRFADRLGQVGTDGSIQMMPFTHELLSQVVGTSREIITHYMNRFRRQGYVRYSRREIVVYRDALREWLRQPAA